MLYLTDETTAADIRVAKAGGYVVAAKLYPAGATTNSAHGVTAIDKIYPALEAMAEVGMPLLVHAKSPPRRSTSSTVRKSSSIRSSRRSASVTRN